MFGILAKFKVSCSAYGPSRTGSWHCSWTSIRRWMLLWCCGRESSHSQLLWHLLAWLLLLQLRHLRNSQSLFVFAIAACRCNPPPPTLLSQCVCVCKCCLKVHAPCASAAVWVCTVCPECIYKFICMCLLRSAPFGLPAVWPTLSHLNWKFSGVLNFQFAIIWPGNQCLLCRLRLSTFSSPLLISN